jgi:uncharacterized protein
MSGLGCTMLSDQPVPVVDNVSLAADIYLPQRPGRYPAVVVFSAYSKELQTAGAPTGTNETGSPPVFTDRGYVHIIVARRGMGRSQGKTGVFFNDRDVDDHERVIAWAAEQPWCDGNVVLFGTSYYGMVQPQVAVRRPPALKAFFSNEMCTDYFRHIVQFGGAPALYFVSLWMGANFTRTQIRLHVPPLIRALASQILNSPLKRFWWPLVQKRMTAIMRGFIRNTPVREVREWYVNWMIDGKTREQNIVPSGPYAELGKIEIPFVTVQNLGYLNLHQFGSYELLEKAGTPGNRKWLILSTCRFMRGSWKRSPSLITSCAALPTATPASRRCGTGSTAPTVTPALLHFRFPGAYRLVSTLPRPAPIMQSTDFRRKSRWRARTPGRRCQ